MGKFCEQCGSQLKPGAAFCEACGARVKSFSANGNMGSGGTSNVSGGTTKVSAGNTGNTDHCRGICLRITLIKEARGYL